MSVSATIAAAIRLQLASAEQEQLDRALEVDANEDRDWSAAAAEVHAKLLDELEW